MNPQQQQNSQGYGQFTEQPVAYDQYGNPLYAHPMQQVQAQPLQQGQQMPQPQAQQMPYMPPNQQAGGHAGGHHSTFREPDFSPEAMRLHEESIKKYPNLNLSKGEYVLRSITRHPIGVVKIWAIAGLLVVALMIFLVGLFMNDSASGMLGIADTSSILIIAGALVGLVSLLVIAGATVATYVYNSNKFYLTNESIIQEIRESIFSRFDHTVNLGSIEDVSYHQDGIIASMFDFGVIQLSTVGDESTYRFTNVIGPRHESAVLNNAVECYKSGRPVDISDVN